MPDFAADDSKTISERLAELRRERSDRIHYFGTDSRCSVCGRHKDGFSATFPCPGEKAEGTSA